VTVVDLRPYQEAHAAARVNYPRRSTQQREAFENLFRAAIKAGQPLDALRRYAANETERFFAQTLDGTDGHVYWDGSSNGFKRNDRKIRSPRRWWWAHLLGTELGPYEDLVPTCGELKCINPEHCEVGRGLRRRQFTDAQMLGAVQVAALRLGRAPRAGEWETLGLKPSYKLYKIRFGAWKKVVLAAGLEYTHPRHGGIKASPELCLESLRHLHTVLGHWPNEGEFRRNKALLHEAHLPAAPGTIRKNLGLWNDALRKAGKR
jgi:hypothetical protein